MHLTAFSLHVSFFISAINVFPNYLVNTLSSGICLIPEINDLYIIYRINFCIPMPPPGEITYASLPLMTKELPSSPVANLKQGSSCGLT